MPTPETPQAETPRLKVRPIFAWYDMWVGAFWDAKKRRLYVFPLPTLGFWIEWPRKCSDCKKVIYSDDQFDYCGRPHCASCCCDNNDFDNEIQ